jgi:hypothetical protein
MPISISNCFCRKALLRYNMEDMMLVRNTKGSTVLSALPISLRIPFYSSNQSLWPNGSNVTREFTTNVTISALLAYALLRFRSIPRLARLHPCSLLSPKPQLPRMGPAVSYLNSPTRATNYRQFVKKLGRWSDL